MWYLRMWHVTNLRYCDMWHVWDVMDLNDASCCLDNLETWSAFLSIAYILRSALNKQTNIPVEYLTFVMFYLKTNQNYIFQTSDASKMRSSQFFVVNLTFWHSSYLKFSFLHRRPSGEIIIIFLTAYFPHWNLIRNINKRLSLVKSRCKKFRIQDWG